MAFVKEFRNFNEPFPEWEYLNSIGVRDMFGYSISKHTAYLVVDRENNYYLIPQGHTGLAYLDEDINYYALCINDKIIKLEVIENGRGRGKDKNIEKYWNIKKVILPYCLDDKELDEIELKKIIEEAFIAETYSRAITIECIKSITVELTTPFIKLGGECEE